MENGEFYSISHETVELILKESMNHNSDSVLPIQDPQIKFQLISNDKADFRMDQHEQLLSLYNILNIPISTSGIIIITNYYTKEKDNAPPLIFLVSEFVNGPVLTSIIQEIPNNFNLSSQAILQCPL